MQVGNNIGSASIEVVEAISDVERSVDLTPVLEHISSPSVLSTANAPENSAAQTPASNQPTISPPTVVARVNSPEQGSRTALRKELYVALVTTTGRLLSPHYLSRYIKWRGFDLAGRLLGALSLVLAELYDEHDYTQTAVHWLDKEAILSCAPALQIDACRCTQGNTISTIC